MLTKSFDAVHTHETNPDLALIRRYTQRDVQADEVWCGALKSCNTRVDRSGERFTKAYLERFAQTLPGKPLLSGHDYRTRPLGRLYAASVLPEGDHWFLKTLYYVKADSPLVGEVELGIAKDCSIGFNAGRRTCDLCGKAWLPYGLGECEHDPLADYEGRTCTVTYDDAEVHKAEGMEMSLVWVGCQPGAEAIPKVAWPAGSFGDPGRIGGGTATSSTIRTYLHSLGWEAPKENRMEIKEALAEIERLKALPLAADREKALLDEITALKGLKAQEPLIREGEQYREFLKGELFRMADSLDVANNDAEKGKRKMYEALLANVKDPTAETLEGMRKSLAVEFNSRFSRGQGSTDTGGDDRQVKREATDELLGRLAGGIV